MKVGKKKVAHQSVVISGTGQITGRNQLEAVRNVMVEALEELGHDVPEYLRMVCPS